ncbi:uncharacterized protein BCR38DRAFT_439561 [Pseudomassariella vexata]|uniref:Uncharacterized protein n=1 Tax=Pseudomassariella vexata TaxID=1141098 RepID=A0A1Y2DPL4_9PEZI|nr:uncharacterized protein BCR38DRAFT_439561 [Pseudomassariella vexata]ORY61200.1 hypothetical protein BCR38DRAFT_439561 [Pseudomassariella vexata]
MEGTNTTNSIVQPSLPPPYSSTFTSRPAPLAEPTKAPTGPKIDVSQTITITQTASASAVPSSSNGSATLMVPSQVASSTTTTTTTTSSIFAIPHPTDINDSVVMPGQVLLLVLATLIGLLILGTTTNFWYSRKHKKSQKQEKRKEWQNP